jgi:tRNA(Arg) A34 adenosine deaminase TadA
LGIGVAKALALSLALEAREARTARKEVPVGALQIFERLLFSRLRHNNEDIGRFTQYSHQRLHGLRAVASPQGVAG